MCRWTPASNLTHFCVLCCFQRQKGLLETSLSFLVWVWKAARKGPFEKLWSKGPSPTPGLDYLLQEAASSLLQWRRLIQTGARPWGEGAPGVWGQHGVVEISRQNGDNGTSSYPGESEEKGLMTSETCSFPLFPEMPNRGASYQSREWNLSEDGFGLLQWQPAPLLNTLWKQFLIQ